MRYVLVCLLAGAVATTTVIGALVLTPSEARASLATVKTCNGDTIELSGAEKHLLELHNKARTKRGLRALCVHPALTKAARAHSRDMLARHYVSHTSPDGETIEERLRRFGYISSDYSHVEYGENIFWGYGSGNVTDYAFKWWMDSPDHRANILNEEFRQIGIGIRRGTYKGHPNVFMYTVDLGARTR